MTNETSKQLTADERAALREALERLNALESMERMAAGDWMTDPHILHPIEASRATRELEYELARNDLPRLLDAYDALLALVRRALPHLAFGVDESTPEVYALVRDMRAWVEAEAE